MVLRELCAEVRLRRQSDDKKTHQGDGETHPEQDNDNKIKLFSVSQFKCEWVYIFKKKSFNG